MTLSTMDELNTNLQQDQYALQQAAALLDAALTKQRNWTPPPGADDDYIARQRGSLQAAVDSATADWQSAVDQVNQDKSAIANEQTTQSQIDAEQALKTAQAQLNAAQAALDNLNAEVVAQEQAVSDAGAAVAAAQSVVDSFSN